MRRFQTLLAILMLIGMAQAATIQLRVLGTSDLHTSILSYDYYQDKSTPEFGLDRTATLINQARAEVKNSLLYDNGDLIQGNPLGDYVARVKPLGEGEMHPIHKAMAVLGYDGATLGNHEFNYGLDFLNKVLAAAPMPYVSANIYHPDGDKNRYNDEPVFTPYLIQDKTFVDNDGKNQVLRVGVIGFVPPQILQWDRGNLEGKFSVRDMVESAQFYVPGMKQQGADLVIALAHTGINTGPYTKGGENAAAELTKVEGIDVVLTGHSHLLFPSATFKDLAGVDLKKGTINNKPVAMPGFWGNNLGVVDLKLEQQGNRWVVVDAQTNLRPIWDSVGKKSLAEPDPSVMVAGLLAHRDTLQYVRGKVADLVAPINSYFALVQDDPSVQLVNLAQMAYVKNALKGTAYEQLPILSAAAPFKAGGRSGPGYYTDIPAGTLAIKNIADLYIYPNTVKAVKVTGAQVKEWLERSAGQFKQINPVGPPNQELVDAAFPTYNFDVIDGVTYDIDVSQPSRYNLAGQLVNPGAERIKNLRFAGQPIDLKADFVVATNNYRASGGGNFPGLDGKNIILDAADENRQAIIQYFTAQGKVNPSADGNWTLTKVPGVSVMFTSSPAAEKYLPSDCKKLAIRPDGFAEYQMNW